MAMVTTNEVFQLEIRKLTDGGYMVGDGWRGDGGYRDMRFASTSIEEALKYIKSKLEPKQTTKPA